MASPREILESENLGQLADRMQQGPGSSGYYPALAEVERRKNLSQIEATKAQKDAAVAQKDAADSARAASKYMLWSVWAILAAAAVQAVVSVLAWIFPRH